MNKLMYKKDFLRLLKASEAAEKGYALFLRDVFQYPKTMSLEAMLRDIFGGAPNKSLEQKQIMQQIFAYRDNPTSFGLQQKLIDKFTTLFGEGERLDRTKEALIRIFNTSKPATINKEIGFIIGNYKEWFFLQEGQQQLATKSNKKNRGLLGVRARLIDEDNIQMDFILGEALSDPYLKRYGQKQSLIQYVSNGVPLEYKSNLSSFHWFDKTYNNNILSPIITHHAVLKGTPWDKDYANIIIDVTMKAIYDKINKGFPVFVTRALYTNEDSFILCSTILKSLSTIAGLQTNVIDQSSYGGLVGLQNLNEKTILKIIKEDRESKDYIEHQIKNLINSGEYYGDDLGNKIEELEKEESAINLLKGLLKKESIKLSITYGKK